MSRRPAARLLLALLLLGVVFGAAPTPASAESPSEDQIQRAVAFARDQVYPALVNISVVARQFSQGREIRGSAAGSGVIISPSGLVVTNFHVAGDAQRVTCDLPSGESIDAEILCGDPLTDLCILQLNMEQREDTTKPIHFANLGDSAKLLIGDHVMAMGNPRSLSSSITLGIVSNTTRVFTSFTGDRIESLEIGSGQTTGIFNQWIQHDALIQPGNSGGPLVNMRGEVVGINTRGGSGVGFAIPSNTVKYVLNQAVTYGEVRRGWMGISVYPVKQLDLQRGALVSSIMPDGPAAKAGLKPGDVILAIEDDDVSVTTLEEVPLFLARIANLPQNKVAKVTYERGGEVHTVDVLIAPMEKTVGVESVYPIWGVSALGITAPMAFRRGYPDTSGVLINTVRPGSAPDSAKPGIQGGDVILEIDGEAVNGPDDFDRLMKKHKRSKALAVRFRRGKRDMVTVLDLSKKPKRRGSAELSKAWLGVLTQVVTAEVAKALGLEGKKGFRITRVLPGTEAEKAGLKAGDVVTHLDGEVLDASEVQDARLLTERIEDKDIGREATLTIIRDGKSQEISVALEETPETSADARSAADEVLEYAVREMTYMDRVDRDLPVDYEGIVVADVTSGGWANVAGLRAGDVLVLLQDKEVKSIKAFKAVVQELGEARPKRVKFFVMRGRSTAFVFVQPEWPQ